MGRKYMHERMISLTLLSVAFLVIGDAVLQIVAVGALPTNSVQWNALVRPEIVNGLTFVVLMALAGMISRSPAAVVGGLVAAAVVSTGIHRWMAGAEFTPMIIAVYVILYVLLGWVSVWIAGMILNDTPSTAK